MRAVYKVGGEMLTIHDLLRRFEDKEFQQDGVWRLSDLHLKVGEPAAFRLDNVDDGYHSPLTFNRLYIRTDEDLQLYYVEAILCAIKNRIRERGGGRPDLSILADLILGDASKSSELEEIESQLQGADRPFKKPPRYSSRWSSTSANTEARESAK